jgi:hypothetical protein
MGETVNITAQMASAACRGAATSVIPSFMMPLLSLVAYMSTFLFGNICAAPLNARNASIKLPSYPVAVKHPYLSTWVPGRQLDDIASARPQFWAGQNLSWPVMARVDNFAYALFGVPDPWIDGPINARTVSVSYTSTHTLFHLTAGAVEVTLDFFSPVSPAPEDYALQSLPYSYLTVSVHNPTDSASSVQIAAGIDQTWTNQNGASQLNFTTTDSAQIFQFHNPDEILFTETDEAMATYGTVVWATSNDDATSHALGNVSEIFGGFAATGSVNSTEDHRYHDLAALSKDLGRIPAKETRNVTFAVGFDRTDAINYLGDIQTGYYRSQWPNIPEAVDFVLQNYDSAHSASQAFDKEVRERSEAVSDVFGKQYADIIEASVRQTFGALELTVSVWKKAFPHVSVSLTLHIGPKEQPLGVTFGVSQRDLKQWQSEHCRCYVPDLAYICQSQSRVHQIVPATHDVLPRATTVGKLAEAMGDPRHGHM